MAASASGFSAFAAGTVLRMMGLTGINTMSTIIIADTTSARQRGFGVNFQFFPFLVLPWVSAEIVSKVVSPGGIGWHWGIGIIGIIIPFAMAPTIVVLLVYQRRAETIERSMMAAAGTGAGAPAMARPKITLYNLASNIDLGGLVIMVVSLAFILLPLSLAGLQTDGYRTPWIIALIVVGGVSLLTLFPSYESRVAVHPVFPLRYVKNRAILVAFLLYFTDYMAAAASHQYLYNWALIAQGLSIVQATDLSFVNGVFTFLVGMVFGLIMWKTRYYKWWLMAGCVVRIIGYGVMFRIRDTKFGATTPMAELFVVQVLQGCGDGIVQTGGYIAATINVQHKETAQIVALIVLVGMLGQSIGKAIASAIYTSTFVSQLEQAFTAHSVNYTAELINDIYNTVDLNIPEWGTPARQAITVAVRPSSSSPWCSSY